MPESQTYHLHPYGWEDDPEQERFKLSTLDYLSACTYNMYALFFRLDESLSSTAVDALKAGLERTLSQARHLCGTIEKDPDGGHSFTKKKDSTVKFVVQWVDKDPAYPSIDEIEATHFSAVRLGDLKRWSVQPMTYGEKSEAHPDASPAVAAYKANFVRGGLVFIMHHHHYANDVMGWAGLTHQLAENCYAVLNHTPFPLWDPANLDVSRLTKPDPAEEDKVDGPTPPQPTEDQLPGIALLFHLPKSKAAELKRLATPKAADGSWISTYDAFSAFILRTLTRLRAPVYKLDTSKPLFWAEAVDMRRRMHSPPVPARLQGNVMSAAMNINAPAEITHPTIADIISHANPDGEAEWPLWRLASYIRQLTNSVTQERLDAVLTMVSRVRDKAALKLRIDCQPLMSILQTDHRDANVSQADFGFARPITYRHLLDFVTPGLIIIYPPRVGSGPHGDDEGCEFSIVYERELSQTLIDDPQWNAYFEFRGVDAVDISSAPEAPEYRYPSQHLYVDGSYGYM
ncbi:transferase family-domain-containing protein [Aspergillus tetrazonus]